MKYYRLGPGFLISLDEQTKRVVDVLDTPEKKRLGVSTAEQYYLTTKHRVTDPVNAFVEIDAAEFNQALEQLKSAI